MAEVCNLDRNLQSYFFKIIFIVVGVGNLDIRYRFRSLHYAFFIMVEVDIFFV
jgi:hypothetical protein